MNFSRLALCGLLLSLSLVSYAQNASSDAPPRFYGGLAVYSSDYQSLGHVKYIDGKSIFPLQATLGYQLRPRLAVQLGVAYSSFSGSSAGTSRDFSTGLDSPYAGKYANWSVSASALGRYTLTREPAHRFQFDLLGGLTVEHSAYHGSGFYPDATQPGGSATYNIRSYANNYLLTAGASARYRLSPRFEAVHDLMVNDNLDSPKNVTYSNALGLRYRFGRR